METINRPFHLAFRAKGGSCLDRGTITVHATDWSDAVIKAANFCGPLNLEPTALEDSADPDRLDSRLLLVEAALESQTRRLDAVLTGQYSISDRPADASFHWERRQPVEIKGAISGRTVLDRLEEEGHIKKIAERPIGVNEPGSLEWLVQRVDSLENQLHDLESEVARHDDLAECNAAMFQSLAALVKDFEVERPNPEDER